MKPSHRLNLPHLETERLVVRLAGDEDVPAIVRYFNENREHLRPYEPARPPIFYEERYWSAQVKQFIPDFLGERALRFFLFLKDRPATIVGTANFTQLQRGVAQSCSLGYGLAASAQGQGYMYEALRPALDFVFGSVRLHRVEANYMPHNQRSGRLLRRLGFTVEGYARDYLLINGRWEDHILTSLTNPEWEPPQPAG